MTISWCKRNNQLVTTTYNKQVQLWTVGTPYTLSSIFSVELPTTVPHAVYFHGADVLVFGMYDGQIHTLHGKDGVILATKTIGRMIGNVAINVACSSFVIDNAVNGFSLNRMEDAVCTRTYDINPKKGFPKQAIIVEGGSMVVGRGNDRSIYVFDKGTSEVVQMLQHSTTLSILRSAWHTILHLTALVAIVMFALQMRGEDGAINPLTWKHNLISTYWGISKEVCPFLLLTKLFPFLVQHD
ncbi:hypothetical protein EDC04DRAFT_2636054 [Pisolithus marmoratus]|nr:hypothetical protein EDC04DRAFT_2636054 [Pisolithus marmoratus]